MTHFLHSVMEQGARIFVGLGVMLAIAVVVACSSVVVEVALHFRVVTLSLLGLVIVLGIAWVTGRSVCG
jgi:hypothetical protein